MKATCIVVLAAALSAAAADTANPVAKVLELLSDMQTKIVKEGEEAQADYAKTAEWCEERSKDLGFELKTSKADIASLKATIEEESATAEALNTKVEELAGSISTDEADLKAATGIREKEHADFVAQEKGLTEVIDALQRAIAIIERESQEGGASMIQLKNAASIADAMSALVDASAINSADANRLVALVQSRSKDTEDDASFGAPAAAVYESHSGGIIETLEGLLEKAEAQLDSARKQETAASHNFEMLKQSLEDEIKFANKDMAKAKKGIAESAEKKSTAEGDLEVTSKDLKADTDSLGDLHQTCMTKAQDFEAETKSRGEELEALTVAKKAISDNTAASSKLAYGLNQVSLIQMSSGVKLASFEAVHLVRDLARKNKSPALAQLASRIAAAMQMGAGNSDDPFGKVKGLISDMIDRLESEAQSDANHKAYCDKEMSESNAKLEDKTAEIAKLSTKIDQMSSRSAQLKEEVAGLQKALADLAASGAEMDKMRTKEHQEFVKNKADMSQGLEGVKIALKVLRDYYGKEKAHEANEGGGSGVIGLLEVVESDFSKELAEMTATEESAQAAYDTETKENEVERTTKEQDVKYKEKEATGLDKAVGEATSDRSGVQTELDAVNEYLVTLKKECVAEAETYEERKARFESELAGLREALRVLESETVLLQRNTKHFLRGVKHHA